jgi:hypothetical protein
MGIFLCSSSAWAQTPETPGDFRLPNDVPLAPAPPPPDVVVLKNGNRYRGTIAELVNGGSLTIVLVTGETRKLDAADVSYAGPADREPRVATATPEPTPTPPAAESSPELPRVRFSSPIQGTGFFQRADGRYTRICVAPCVKNMPAGTYDIGVKRPLDEEVVGIGDVLVEQPVSISAVVHDRHGVRKAGALVLTVSAMVLGFSTLYLTQAEHPNTAAGASFVVTGVAGSIVGLSLAFVGDRVSVSVTPRP